MHKKMDGVAIGSQQDPDLANIFVGDHEEKLFSETPPCTLIQICRRHFYHF